MSYAQQDTLNKELMHDIMKEVSPIDIPKIPYSPNPNEIMSTFNTDQNFGTISVNNSSKVDTQTEAFKQAEEILQILKPDQRKDYETEAIRIVESFGNYLSLIVDPETHTDDIPELVELALSLIINRNIEICNNIQSLSEYQTSYSVEDFLEEIQKVNNLEINWRIAPSTKTFNLESIQEDIEVVEAILNSDFWKTVQVYFIHQKKLLYGIPKEMYQIKIGDVKCKQL